MAKFLIIYNSDIPAGELMAQSSREQMDASRDAWIKWKEQAEKTVKFEFGTPVQAVGRVTKDGVTDSDTPASGYSIMEGDKDQVEEILKSHPQLQRPGASIDVLEMLAMPGIDA